MMRRVQPSARSRRSVVNHTFTLHLTKELITKISRLLRQNPQKSLDDLIVDFISLGIPQFEGIRMMPKKSRAVSRYIVGRPPVYLPTGAFAEFHRLVYRHHLALEHAKAREESQSTSGYSLLED